MYFFVNYQQNNNNDNLKNTLKMLIILDQKSCLLELREKGGKNLQLLLQHSDVKRVEKQCCTFYHPDQTYPAQGQILGVGSGGAPPPPPR